MEADSLLSCSQEAISGPFHMWGYLKPLKTLFRVTHGLPITHNAKEYRPSNVDWEKETT